MFLQILILVIGFIFLIKGADIFVDGASCTARHLKISKMFVGLTIVAFGTSAPEFAVSVKALLSNSSDMVLGNVIGSNITNILLILGVGALISPITIKDNTVKKEIPLCLILTLLLSVLFLDKIFAGSSINSITRGDAISILLVFTIFLYYIFTISKNKIDKKEDNDDIPYGMVKSIIFIVLGLIGIVLGSNMVVDSATFIARYLGVSERIISLTIIAIGTSLPELATTITSSLKKEQDILVGNVIGSNIFNICVVLGIPVTLFGSVTSTSFTYIDIIFFIIAPVLLFMFSRSHYRISKLEGFSLILLYLTYYMLVFVF
jgi:cation:H+ antiporter